jgi:hypothetical protein
MYHTQSLLFFLYQLNKKIKVEKVGASSSSSSKEEKVGVSLSSTAGVSKRCQKKSQKAIDLEASKKK